MTNLLSIKRVQYLDYAVFANNPEASGEDIILTVTQ